MKKLLLISLLAVASASAATGDHAGRLFDRSDEGTRSCTIKNDTGRLIEVSDESNRCFIRVHPGHEVAYAVCGKGNLRIRADDERGKLRESKYYKMSFNPKVQGYRAEWRDEPLTKKEQARLDKGKKVKRSGHVVLIHKETGAELLDTKRHSTTH